MCLCTRYHQTLIMANRSIWPVQWSYPPYSDRDYDQHQTQGPRSYHQLSLKMSLPKQNLTPYLPISFFLPNSLT